MTENNDIAKAGSTVLVVDDEPILRMAAVDFLEESGLSVAEAGSADEALRILASRDEIRLVFSDIQMPGSVDGVGLAILIRHCWPDIRVILTSGNVRPSPHVLPQGVILMPKPYQPSTLVPLIRVA